MKTFALLFLSLLYISPAAAAVYKYIDPQGRVYYTDQKKDRSYHLLAKLHFENDHVKHGSSYGMAQFRANKKKFSPLITAAAARYKLEPALIHAVIYVESSYDPEAKSTSDCIGLMQLKPSTARRYGVNDAWPPKDNIRAGSLYLSYLIRLFKGDIRLALAGYNAGENAVLRNNSQIPNYPETRRYVKKVMRYYQKLRRN
ncbi:MAG: transglycosylase SLT domain-containing protein [Mariprofundaceae bacterium]|nr:transglycosylase SLT domain-containing protein [Mariprofundaceae bacterium]